MWLTDFPPPPGFEGYESGEWDGLHYYERVCTPEEVALLDANEAAAAAEGTVSRAEEEACRDAWFDMLRGRLPADR